MSSDGAAGAVRLSEQQDLAGYLELLAEIGQDFASSGDIGASLDKALSRIAENLDAEAASLFLLESDDKELVCHACFGPADILGLHMAATEGIVGRSVQDNVSLIVRDVRKNPDFAVSVDADSGFTTRSILCAPLSVKEHRVGAIELLNKRGGDGLFSEDDQHVLQVLASSYALALINARLTSVLIEQETVRRELALAAEIQRALLPRRAPGDFPVAGINVPARGVSGDFYDIFILADGRVCFNVGDVAGKGINAALLMAKASSLFRCLGKAVHEPGKLLQRVNTEICETGTRGMFVTMVGGIYDPRTDVVRYANAGHEPPLYRSAGGDYRSFPAEAPPLGIAADIVPENGYPVAELQLNGGTFSVFTDGITEGRREDGEMLGLDGLKALMERHHELLPAERITAIVDSLDRPGAVLHDDLTILTIESLAPRGPA